VTIAADTSVIVAAFASWHEHHDLALDAVGRVDLMIGHCLLETYSVLTRLPAPHRMAPQAVADYLRLAFGRHALAVLPGADQRKLVATCAAEGLAGGAIYDALIAATCRRAGARLLTLDTRARPTYAVLGVEHELLA
jgi:predicted nucleic acid-binding protein